MKFRLCLLVLLSFAVVNTPLRADTLRVMTYNALNFVDEDDSDRLDDFRIVIDYVNPDVVAMQEIHTEEAMDLLLSFAFLPTGNDWAAAQFEDGPDTDNILFYRTSKVELLSQRAIPTDPRDVNEYVLRPLAPDTSQRIRVFSAHLKAGDTSSDQNRRAASCTAMRQQFDLLEAGSLFMFVGDFNLYTSAEEAYGILLSESPDPDGQLFDPIDTPGNWHNAISFADVHTQSPRTNSFGGGASGGMDDRFDFILVSSGLMDTSGTHVIPATYYAVGNDGEHFNESINDGFNFVVPDSVADALYYAADHLPVVVDLLLQAQGTPVADVPAPRRIELLSCYPNPFNSSLTIQIADPRAPATLSVYDLLGRRVHEQAISAGAARVVQLNFTTETTGTYLIQLQSNSVTEVQKVFQVR